MKTRLSSTEPPAPAGFINATFAEVLEDGARKIAVHVPLMSNWWGRFVIAGLPDAATDILVNRYRIVLEPGQIITLRKCATTAKTGPVGSSFEADILVSTDNGLTWDTIFASGKAVIVNGNFKGDETVFAIDILNPDDLLRVDVVGNDGEAEGIEIVLEGYVTEITSPL